MVTPLNVGEVPDVLNFFGESLTGQKIIDPPPHIFFAAVTPVGPPRVVPFFFRVVFAEDVVPATLESLTDPGPFFG